MAVIINRKSWSVMNRLLIRLVVLCFAGPCVAQTEKPIEESPKGVTPAIGYSTVENALAALRAKPGVDITVSKPDGWTIIKETSPEFAVWSFTPRGHYADPAVVKRVLKQSDGKVSVVTTALCQADKISCDKLVREFLQMNTEAKNQVKAELESR